jgi:hypothetical protein
LNREWESGKLQKHHKNKSTPAFQLKIKQNNALKSNGGGGKWGASYYLSSAVAEAASVSTKNLQTSKFPLLAERWRGTSCFLHKISDVS